VCVWNSEGFGVDNGIGSSTKYGLKTLIRAYQEAPHVSFSY
jgi:hypothetical protein